jgi:hypothetical protein
MSNVESSRFDFDQFQRMTALNGETIWAYLVDRHADRIGVKRRKPALEYGKNLRRHLQAGQ